MTRLLALFAVLFAIAPAVIVRPWPSGPAARHRPSRTRSSSIQTQGRIVVKLQRPRAQQRGADSQLAQDKYYDNVPFHRVIMASWPEDRRRPERQRHRRLEIPQRGGRVLQRAVHARHRRRMARANDPNSANSQFFIMFADAAFLNGKYTVSAGCSRHGCRRQAQEGRPAANGSVTGPDKMVTVRVASDVK
jgi:peptidylprolyl isomerase